MLHRSLLALVTLALLTGLAACGAPQAPGPDALQSIRIQADDDGNLQFSDPSVIPRGSGTFILEPATWPDDTSLPRPAIAIGETTDEATPRPVLHGMRQHRGFDHLQLRFTDSLQPLPGSKTAVEIVSVEGDIVRLRGGERAGMLEGDYYVVANRPGPITRSGQRIGALMRITDVIEREATARILHAAHPISTDHVALFAHMEPDERTQPVSIIACASSSTGATAPLDEAVFALVEEYGLTNVTVELSEIFVDPASQDSPERIEEEFDRDTFTTVVYWQEANDGSLVWNVTSVGRTPRYAPIVGIMGGGARLDEPSEDRLRGIALSSIAAGLAARGDHAVAAYMLEEELRRRGTRTHLDAHLREHLALRYTHLDRFADAFQLMNEDILMGQESGDVWLSANAQSIRAMLHFDTGSRRGWAEDTLAYADAALDIEPEEFHWRNQLTRVTTLAMLGRIEEAERAIAVAERALAVDEDPIRGFMLQLERVLLLEAMEDTAGALLVLGASEPEEGSVDDNVLARYHMLSAELYLGVDDRQRALRHLEQAVRFTAADAHPPASARLHQRAGNILRLTGQLHDAATAYEHSARAYVESGQYHDAVDLLGLAGHMHLERLQSLRGPDAGIALRDALSHLTLSGQLALGLGRTSHTAHTLLITGMFDLRLGEPERGLERMRRAWDLGTISGDFVTMADAAETIANALREAGQDAEAETWAERERLWRGLLDEPSEAPDDEPAPQTDEAPSAPEASGF